MKNFFDRLCVAAGGNDRVKQNEPMKKHTTFRAGGSALYFAEPKGEEALAAVLSLCRAEKMPYYILGNGSNLLVSDAGYAGVMIFIGEAFSGIEKRKPERIKGQTEEEQKGSEGVCYRAGAGLLLSRIAKEALTDSLTGVEFAAGIPGTLGGAVVMNAGAYGKEMKDIIRHVRVMDALGEVLELNEEDLELRYRHSNIPEKEYIVLSADLELRSGKQEEIQALMEELAGRRREKQPLEYPSAGSTFKRPEGYFAGKLIEDAGLRGFRYGGAQVSEKHCGFVINRDQATAEEIRYLCGLVQKKVKESSGVELECEIKLVGWETEPKA